MSSETLCSCNPKHSKYDNCPNIYLLKCSICKQYGHTRLRCPDQVYEGTPSAIPQSMLEATGFSEPKDLENLCVLLFGIIKKHRMEHGSYLTKQSKCFYWFSIGINSKHAMSAHNLREDVQHIQGVLQSVFKSNKVFPIKDIENVHDQIKGLGQ